jgi:hypothetical protein
MGSELPLLAAAMGIPAGFTTESGFEDHDLNQISNISQKLRMMPPDAQWTGTLLHRQFAAT